MILPAFPVPVVAEIRPAPPVIFKESVTLSSILPPGSCSVSMPSALGKVTVLINALSDKEIVCPVRTISSPDCNKPALSSMLLALRLIEPPSPSLLKSASTTELSKEMFPLAIFSGKLKPPFSLILTVPEACNPPSSIFPPGANSVVLLRSKLPPVRLML